MTVSMKQVTGQKTQHLTFWRIAWKVGWTGARYRNRAGQTNTGSHITYKHSASAWKLYRDWESKCIYIIFWSYLILQGHYFCQSCLSLLHQICGNFAGWAVLIRENQLLSFQVMALLLCNIFALIRSYIKPVYMWIVIYLF
jgi:hypothetical protein